MTKASEQANRLFSTGVAAESLPGALERWAAEQGDQRAFTFVDYQTDPAGTASSLTWRELDAWVDAVAAWCQRGASSGDRVAVLIPQSLDYVAAFLGVLRAGLVAVPLFEPSPLPGHEQRLAAVLADCAPALVLTTAAHADQVEDFLTQQARTGPRIGAVDVLANVPAGAVRPVPSAADDLAYLQYTSGSTRSPAGVMITHGNVVCNARQGIVAYQAERGRTTSVSWLPLFHDMGLVVGMATPVLGGFAATLLDPIAFLTRPQRWLEQLAATPGPAVSAAPNFAYGYTASRTTEEEKQRLRLAHVVSLGDGSEPVLASTLDNFYAAFAGCGLDPRMHRHTYGLAEAVVLVSVSPAGTPPRRVRFDRASLAAGVAVPVDDAGAAGSLLVSAGEAVDQLVRIADPESGVALPEGRVGEIWSSGLNVGLGYWGSPDSAEVFEAELLDERAHVIKPYPGSRGWLRTGDLGVLLDGDLFITGRLKDLIIVDGHNHYPQDIEHSAEQAHRAVRRHAVAAFSTAGERGERAVVVAERAKQVTEAEVDHAEVAAAVRAAASREHGLQVADVVLIGPGELARTSSGKIQRAACRERYEQGTWGTGLPA